MIRFPFMNVAKTKYIPFFVLGGCLLAGCASPQKGPQPMTTTFPSAQNTPAHTATPAPTPTNVPTPEPTATPAPTPTSTPRPTPTGTAGEVCFSSADYFFTDNTFIELSVASKKKSGYITYTLDGSEPTKTETLYTEPILLVTNTGDFPNVYSIKAKVWYDDGTVSDTCVHTYFLNENIHDRYTTAVFSINGDPSELTGSPDGILYGENYKDRGRASERKVYIEAISSDGTRLFEQFAGVRVFGGTSREHAVKSLKLFARSEYQNNKGTFGTSMFGSTTLDGKDLIKKYDKLVLRNAGDDFQSAFLRDEMVQRLAAAAGFDAYEAVVPALAYVNGSYYGFYWLHESYCDKYFQYRNGKSDGEYIVLEGSDKSKSVSGDANEIAAAKEFNALYKKYAYANLTNDATYAELCALVDVENYMDYMSLNMYVANYDWPQGNYRCFRYYAAEGEEYGTGEMDGRWRFLMHDADTGFGTYQSSADAGAARNDFEQVLTSSSTRYAPLLAALLKRTDCRDYFINKMLEYMNGALSYESVCTVLDQMLTERDTELAYYYTYLNTLKGEHEIYARPARTELHIERIRSFSKQRPEYILQYMEKFFGVELE